MTIRGAIRSSDPVVALDAAAETRKSTPRRAWRLPLAAKLAAALIGLVAVVLLVNGAVEAWLGYDQAKRAALEVQSEKARSAAERVGEFLSDIQTELGWTTGAEWKRLSLDQQRYDFIRLLREAPAITALSYIDGQGKEQLAVSRLEPDSIASGKDFSTDSRFVLAVADKAWFGPVEFRRGSEPYMTIALAHVGKNGGVTVADVNLKLIWDVISAIHVGEKGYAYVVDDKGRLIAHPDLSLVLRDTDFSGLPQVRQALDANAPAEPGASAAPSAGAAEIATGFDGAKVLTAYAVASRPHWIVFVQQPLSEALASVYRSLLQTLALLALGLLLALIAGGLLARRMVVPIRRLQQGAEKLGAGDLSQRLDIHTGDEIETLADRFNQMASRIQESYETLEAKVETRTKDLNEALQQQTATAEVLKVISRSAFDLQAVFDTLIASAVELSGANRGAIYLRDGEVFRWLAASGADSDYVEYMRSHPRTAGRTSVVGRVALSGGVECIADMLDDKEFELPASVLARGRGVLGVPLLRDGKVEGAIVLTRYAPGLYSQRQIDLVQTFADQAVIAIENVRLFDEVQARTKDLTEALQQQTATADVLKVISRSAFDLQAVLDTLVSSAVDLGGANRGAIFLRDGDVFRFQAASRVNPEYLDYMRAHPQKPGRGSMVARVALSGRIECIPDVLEDKEFDTPANALVNVRTILGVPLLREDRVEGVLVLSRYQPGLFTERQLDLVSTFADQAVIAIENVRLFDEVQARTRDLEESLAQQTATAEVLKVISRSGADLGVMLQTLVDTAGKFCGNSTIHLQEDGLMKLRVHFGGSPEWIAYLGKRPFPAAHSSQIGRAWVTGEIVHIPDILGQTDLPWGRAAEISGYRSTVSVPIVSRSHGVVGVFSYGSPTTNAFPPRRVELLRSFADQAAIAIDNARLLDEVQARTKDLTEALQQQTATAEVLKVISRSAFDLQTVLDTLTVSAATLCEGEMSVIFQRRGDFIHYVSNFGFSDEFAAYARANPFPADGAGSAIQRAVRDGRTVHIHDVLADPEYEIAGHQSRGGFRTVLAVPLLREGEPIGGISIGRHDVRPFNQRQIELVQTFADQAVIAIENTRLFDEVQARTRDLSEALQQQTATADVLKVISRSAFDLQTVLDTLIESAVRLVGAFRGAICLREGDVYPFQATYGEKPEFAAWLREHPATVGRGSIVGRVALSGEVEQIPDAREDKEHLVPVDDYRSLIGVPLLRDGETAGVLVVVREAAGVFTQRQVELLQTFADQAVIAIENLRLFDEVQARTRDLEESLAQQTATADVLKVISRSAFDLQPVFDTLVSTAVRLCDAKYGIIFRRQGDVYRYAASQMDVDPAYDAYERQAQIRPGRGTLVGRVALENRAVGITDAWNDPEYAEKDQARTGNVRAMLGVPLMRNGEPIGAFALGRAAPVPFSNRQIELVTTFADQAVIAIENVRLFDEVQARTRDLAEALQQQTATAEVLKVISRSAFDLQAVFDTLVESAASLCDSTMGGIYLKSGDAFHAKSVIAESEEFIQYLKSHPQIPGRGSVGARVLLTGELQSVADVQLDDEFELAKQAPTNMRASLGIPLKRDETLVGALMLGRSRPEAFTKRQIELAQTFADQAVIAIENVRLFDEVQARTRELEESLQMQTATANVLKVISRSAFDLDAVLKTLTDSARSISGAATAMVLLRDGEVLQLRAESGSAPEFRDYVVAHPPRLGRKTGTGRVLMTGETAHIPDVLADPDYDYGSGPQLGSYRAQLGVPLLRDGKVEGVFGLLGLEPGAFTSRQIELVRAFADQAVIAIENARLFNEVQAKTRDLEEALQLQTATANVLKVISGSAFDLPTVLQTLVESAARLCESDKASIVRRVGDAFYTAETYGFSPEFVSAVRDRPIEPTSGSASGRALRERRMVHVPDVEADAEYTFHAKALGGYRAILAVPMLREGQPMGVLVLIRSEARPFSDRQRETASTFADQAAIAIENARLFGEVQARTEELTASLQSLRSAQDRLIQSEKLASLGQLTAGIAHEIKNPLNFVNNFSALSRELLDELSELLAKAPLEKAARDESDELVATVASNLDKVVSHGRRADSIVKNMLLHAREGSGERTSVNVNAMVEEALNLAYHGARAEKPGFKVTIEKTLDPEAGFVDLYAQEMTRVLLNLISNGFYATAKRSQSGPDASYEPTITATTRSLGDRLAIAIRDNGTGIPDDVKAKMFNPFFTTKPAGEGTGLGLSLSYDIVVKQHGGTLEVSTEPGAFTEFTVILPRTALMPEKTQGQS